MFLLDTSGDIILDANSTDVRLAKWGIQFGMFTNGSQPLLGICIDTLVQPLEIYGLYQSNSNGGSTLTAMTIDRSAGGQVGIVDIQPDCPFICSWFFNWLWNGVTARKQLAIQTD